MYYFAKLRVELKNIDENHPNPEKKELNILYHNKNIKLK